MLAVVDVIQIIYHFNMKKILYFGLLPCLLCMIACSSNIASNVLVNNSFNIYEYKDNNEENDGTIYNAEIGLKNELEFTINTSLEIKDINVRKYKSMYHWIHGYYEYDYSCIKENGIYKFVINNSYQEIIDVPDPIEEDDHNPDNIAKYALTFKLDNHQYKFLLTHSEQEYILYNNLYI